MTNEPTLCKVKGMKSGKIYKTRAECVSQIVPRKDTMFSKPTHYCVPVAEAVK